MKKVLVICLLLALNLCVVYAKIKDQKLDRVDINLKDNEIGIVIINLEQSKSLLIKYKNKNILYLFNYLGKQNIDSSTNIFTDKIDYIYMNNDFSYKTNNKIIGHKNIDDLTLLPNKIIYKEKTICINQSNDCDFVIINQNDILLNKDIKALFYTNNLSTSYLDYLNTFWVDKYRLSNQSYTIITIGDDYQVNNLVK